MSSNHPASFFNLPRELRDNIYTLLLTSYDKRLPTFGVGSDINIAVLLLNKTVHSEAEPILYSTPHKISLHDGYLKRNVTYIGTRYEYIRGSMPPGHAIKRMRNMSVEINFSTTNRGEAELCLNHANSWADKLLYIGTAALHSTVLQTLTISLWNGNQRKVGAKRVRTTEVRQQVRKVLQPLAYLHQGVKVVINGFDTIEYWELFEEMRLESTGKEVPIDDLMMEAMRSLKLYGPRRAACGNGQR
jgi:hypothetical protein